MRLNDLKVGVRLGLAFGIVLLLLGSLSLFSLSGLANLERQIEVVTRVNSVETALANEMRLAVNQQAIRLRNLLMFSELEQMSAEADLLRAERKKYDAARTSLLAMSAQDSAASEQKKTHAQRIAAAEKDARALEDQVIEMAIDNRKFPARTLLTEKANPAQILWLTSLNELVTLNDKLTQEAVADAAATYSLTRTTVIAISLVALVLAGVVGFSVTRSITRPITEAVAIARRVAASDLSVTVQSHSKDETGQLLSALGVMTQSLVKIVSGVRQGTDSIAAASAEIAGGNLDLSSRTERQAANVQQTASSMEKLSSTVRQSASNSTHARQLASDAALVAEQGGQAVTKVVHTMSDINASARKIESIISVIDGIAFQTNILALNAAVEAARAGEQGRGFAVVASEVRVLAQRSANAAKEIKTLIGQSVEKVGEGTQLVDGASKTIQQIVHSVQQVARIVNEITAATVEQSSGIELVNTAVVQMDEATQQNAALVEEVAAAAASLRTQVENLAQEVSVFRLAPA